MRPPERHTLSRVLATAQEIVRAEITPYQGAARIWRLIAEADYRGFEDLRVWAGLASEWQDHPEHRDALDEDIRDEARLLLARHHEGSDPQ